MSRLVGFLLRSSRGGFALAVACGVLGGAAGVALIALVSLALRADAPPPSRLGPAFLAVCALTVAARVAAQVVLIRVAQGSVARLVRHLCGGVLALPLRRFEAHEPGALLAVLTEDVAVLTAALAGLPLLFVNLTVVAGCLAYLGFVAPAVLGCTLAFAAPAVLCQQALTGRGLALLARARAEHDALAGHLRELVEGFKDLKLSGDRREAFLAGSIRTATARLRERSTAGLSAFAAAGGWGQFLYFGFLGFVLFGLPAVVAVPRDAVAAAALTLLFAVSPLEAVLGFLPVLGRASASLARVEALGLSLAGGADVEPEGGPGVPPFPADEPIALRGVTFRHPGENGGDGFTLGPVDLTVWPGEVLFLVGGNGSGKTTLVKLLTGLYEPEGGVVEVGGRAVDGAARGAYRRLFTAVFADGFVFPTLAGPAGPDRDARARALLSDLGLGGAVTVADGAFSTTRLSQGQRKRLALAAACLEDRPVLVLDEWASYQDPRFKRAFYRELIPALKARGKTLVVISHDDAYFDAADRLVPLSGGALAGDVDGGALPDAPAHREVVL